mmetsp:Transcript_35044/g.105877  ORF Transcript_35044/g.105877 Transcript_35044/m.105877 type:complete len:263 (-) Transcript_35044:679-1467(-)
MDRRGADAAMPHFLRVSRLDVVPLRLGVRRRHHVRLAGSADLGPEIHAPGDDAAHATRPGSLRGVPREALPADRLPRRRVLQERDRAVRSGVPGCLQLAGDTQSAALVDALVAALRDPRVVHLRAAHFEAHDVRQAMVRPRDGPAARLCGPDLRARPGVRPFLLDLRGPYGGVARRPHQHHLVHLRQGVYATARTAREGTRLAPVLVRLHRSKPAVVRPELPGGRPVRGAGAVLFYQALHGVLGPPDEQARTFRDVLLSVQR